MLVKQTLASGKIDTIGQVYQIEPTIKEKTRLEVELHLPSGITGDILKRVSEVAVSPANNTLKGRVEPWPEDPNIVSLDGRVIRIRWYKNPLFWEVIWSILRPLLWAALIVTILAGVIWVLNRYFPEAKTIPLAIIGGIALLFFFPSIIQIFSEKRMEQYG